MKPLVLRVDSDDLAGELDVLLSRADQQFARDCDTVVFRFPSKEWYDSHFTDVVTSSQRLIRRSLGKPVWLAGYDERLDKLYSVNVGETQPILREATVDDASAIRTADFRQVFSAVESDSHLAAGPGMHFITPSGFHCSHFVRFADLVRSRESLDTFAYWLAPYVKSHHRVLVDSWGTASAVLSAMIRAEVSIPLECFTAHPNHSPHNAREIVTRLMRGMQAGSKLLIVCGISGSGQLVSQARSLASELDSTGSVEISEASIYSYPSAGGATSFCELGQLGVNYKAASDCDACKSGQRTIRVHPGRFIVTERSEAVVSFPPSMVVPARSFLDRFDVAGMLRVHSQDSFNSGRHHVFDIDVEKMIGQKAFADDMEAALAEVTSIDVIIVPNHGAGRAMAEICRRRFECPMIFDAVQNGEDMIVRERAMLATCKRVLVLDDVVNTGETLRSIEARLRECGASFESVHYIVAVDRAESDESIQEIKNGLVQHHSGQTNSFKALYSLHLPNLPRAQCPWCHEYLVLSELSSSLPDPPDWLLNRISKLLDREGGIDAEPFFMLNGQPQPAIGAGSKLADVGASAMDVLFRIASGIQDLRCHANTSKRLVTSIFQRQVLAGRVIRSNYTEALVRACLLRSVRVDEWEEKSQGEVAKTLIGSGTRNASALAIIPEFMLAAARGALRGFDASDWERLIRRDTSGEVETLIPLVERFA